MLEGVTANMVVAIELIQKAIGALQARRFGRIVNITSGTVKLPQAGLDLSFLGARWTDDLPCRCRAAGGGKQRDDQQSAAWRL